MRGRQCRAFQSRKFSYSSFVSILTMESLRLSLRPTGKDSSIFNFTIIGFDGKDYSELVSSEKALVKTLYETSGLSQQEVEFGDVIWTSKYSPHIRMVDRFQIGRVLVAGGMSSLLFLSLSLSLSVFVSFNARIQDAAHVHSPTGGQGLNSGFVDTVSDHSLNIVLRSFPDVHFCTDESGLEARPCIQRPSVTTVT